MIMCPTPGYQAWLKQNNPIAIQPVDEDIDLPVVETLAKDTNTSILLYREVEIWYRADYIHAVLGHLPDWQSVTSNTKGRSFSRQLRKIAGQVRGSIVSGLRFWIPGRAWRLSFVKNRLGTRFSHP